MKNKAIKSTYWMFLAWTLLPIQAKLLADQSNTPLIDQLANSIASKPNDLQDQSSSSPSDNTTDKSKKTCPTSDFYNSKALDIDQNNEINEPQKARIFDDFNDKINENMQIALLNNSAETQENKAPTNPRRRFVNSSRNIRRQRASRINRFRIRSLSNN